MSSLKSIAIVPARFESTRFPGKPLVTIAQKTMIQHVYERSLQAESVSEVIVATDALRILEAVQAFGGQARMTSPLHRSGTDRVAEVAAASDADVIVNVQGDEPMIEPGVIDQAINAAQRRDADIVTLMTPLDPAQADDPNRVKVVVDRKGNALYFSRSRIPSRGTSFLHIGLYAYRVRFLKLFTKLDPTPLEQAERLEQLRALEHGFRIRVVEVESKSWGIDTPEDLERYLAIIRGDHG